MKKVRGTNQFKNKYRYNKTKAIIFLVLLLLSLSLVLVERIRSNNIISAVVEASSPLPTPTPTFKVTSITVTIGTPTPTVTPTPSELETIVAYITRKFEKEGKDVVIRAINCFYSESGLRPEAEGWNPPKLNIDGTVKEPASFDHGVAQLNDYWHNLTPKQKTDIKANIDKAYEIYTSRKNFSAWYAKGCK